MPKKIIYVITKSNWGGAQKYVYDLSRNLPKADFIPAVVFGSGEALADKLRAQGIRTWTIPYLQKDINPFRELMSILYLTKIFIKEKPDIIHLNSTKAGLLGGISSFLYKVLVLNFRPLTIFTVHGWVFSEKRSMFVRTLFFVLSWTTSFFCNKLILINGADLRTAKKFITKKKLCLIPNGVDTMDFLSREEARREIIRHIGQSADLSDKIWIGCVAELTKNKGVNHLIDAVQIPFLKERGLRAKTFIIGDGEDRQKLKSRIETLDGEKDVFFMGFLENASQYFTAFDLFILPSLKEGLPYVLMEAMLAGIPVIATRVGGVPDLITNGEDGLLVDPQDTGGLAEAILQLFKHPEQRKIISENARGKIVKFSLRDMLNKTIQLYTCHD